MEAIVAIDLHKGIAKNGSIPWKCKEDMQFFRKKTEGHVVVMGKTTFFSLPNGPLPNRQNIVFTRTPELYQKQYDGPNVIFTNDIQIVKRLENQTVFIIGGSQIYDLFLPKCKTVWVSQIDGDYHCDTFFTLSQIDTPLWQKEIVAQHTGVTIYKYQRQV